MNPAIWKSTLWTIVLFTLCWLTLASVATYQELNYPETIAVPPVFSMTFELPEAHE